MLLVFVLWFSAACGQLVGGPKEIPLDELSNSELKSAFRSAEQLFNSNIFLRNYYVISQITNGTSQVVEGVLYHFEVKFSPTNCSIPEVEKSNSTENCVLSGEGLDQICKVQFWSRPWLTNEERMITSITICSQA
ncbi:unnamed protein product [Heterobilharzia americana]|nr:unnamed protein product [Heterobilharzia americana]